MVLQENIAAISTPSGVGGVAIIRISGENPLAILSQMFRPACGIAVERFQPFRMYTGTILAEGFEDHGMAVFFRSPKSYTGENVVEIHCHGGVAIQRGVLERCLALGCRLATRGEFTRRAFLNGKLSLSSSEGLIDMIHAESRAGVAAGYALYREKLYEQIESIRKDLTFALAQIDVQIDYPEEGVEEVTAEETHSALQKAITALTALAATYRSGSMIKNGVKVALCGRPNTGKSSLLNALLGREKAIVTEIAGTTRDVVEGDTELAGVTFRFSDTAGIRESEDRVEKLGVDRSKKVAENADILLFLTETPMGEEDAELITLATACKAAGEKVIVVVNKSDLGGAEQTATTYKNAFDTVLTLSAKTGEGLQALKTVLTEYAASGKADSELAYLTERRHFDVIEETRLMLQNALSGVGILPIDLLAADLTEAWKKLGEITGATAPEEVIDEIFDKFCVGK